MSLPTFASLPLAFDPLSDCAIDKTKKALWFQSMRLGIIKRWLFCVFFVSEKGSLFWFLFSRTHYFFKVLFSPTPKKLLMFNRAHLHNRVKYLWWSIRDPKTFACFECIGAWNKRKKKKKKKRKWDVFSHFESSKMIHHYCFFSFWKNIHGLKSDSWMSKSTKLGSEEVREMGWRRRGEKAGKWISGHLDTQKYLRTIWQKTT